MTESNNIAVNQLRTPLYDLIVAGGARLTAFAGWDMPVQYIGLKQEHLAVRNSVGMFDISHMGKFSLQADDLVQQLQPLVPTDLSKLTPGKAQYTVLLNPQGGIIDDVIFYLQQTSPQRGILIVNAATTEKDKAWLQENLSSSVELQDWSRELVLIALQGPLAAATLSNIVGSSFDHLGAFEHCSLDLWGESVFFARTGYTGEDGFEIMVSAKIGQRLWQQCIEAGVVPCGLGARDTLRLEAGMCLYGQDMDDTTTPLEAGLGWLVDWDKGDFVGKSVLQQQKQQGIPRKLVGLEMLRRGIARHDYPIMADGEQVGVVTSGTFSPSLEQAIALGYVPKSWSRVGQELAVEIRGKLYPVRVVKKPFYRSSKPMK